MVLVYAESPQGKLKKAAFEAVTYGRQAADAMGVQCAALVLGAADNAGELGSYGAHEVYQVNNDSLNNFDSQVAASVVSSAAQKLGATLVVMMHSSSGKALAGRVAVRLDAGLVTAVNALPTISGDAVNVTKNVFSGKAIAEFSISSATRVVSVAGNTFKPVVNGDAASVQTLDVDVPQGRYTVKEVSTMDGVTPLPEAELVVSAGRGMKGPENWGIIEELADILGATTACSRPVADVGWRPHHEHVGQTGVAIKPNLYFAIGISGAIQHLAGVNQSNVIVVINKDPEAPFFKAADYGIVGDLFDVVPRLNESLKKYKAENS